jgi:hypothetical protein
MSAIERNTYSFVVKIWQERREAEEGEPLWRGRVDYVQGGERVYFHCLDRLIAFFGEVVGSKMKVGGEDENITS